MMRWMFVCCVVFNKLDSHLCLIWLTISRGVNERGEWVLPEFGAFEPKHKKHGIKNVGLAITIGPDDASEMRVERADDVVAEIRLEVGDLEMVDFHILLEGQ